MAWTIEDVLGNGSLEDVQRFGSEYRFRLRGLQTYITVRLHERKDGSGVDFEQSHFIKTPLQADPYMTSRPWGDYTAYALHRAVTTLTQYYDAAVSNGHVPEESWLIPNPQF